MRDLDGQMSKFLYIRVLESLYAIITILDTSVFVCILLEHSIKQRCYSIALQMHLKHR